MARETVLPTVVFSSVAKRLSFSWVAASIRTLVLCMQISIHRLLAVRTHPDRTIPVIRRPASRCPAVPVSANAGSRATGSKPGERGLRRWVLADRSLC